MIIYVTNKWAHYQGSVCRELAKIFGPDNFKMLLTDPLDDGDPISDTHKKMNWTHRPDPRPWLIQPPETRDEFLKGEWCHLLSTAEVAVIGAMYGCRASVDAVRSRFRKGLLTFFINERFFKDPITLRDWFSLRFWRYWLVTHWQHSFKNVHYMPIDHYGAEDMKFFLASKGRMWQWAYFPEVSDVPTEKLPHDKMRICWCGRMIPCKRVEYLLDALAIVTPDVREHLEVTIVGEGETRDFLKRRASENGLSELVAFRPFLSPQGVVNFVKEQDVYVFPSDRHEGWGVALQEAMDKCCVPIANTSAGATMAVVEDGVNGFTFEDGDVKRIADKIEWLYRNPDKRKDMGVNAWRKMQEWSPMEGARRFAILLSAIKSGDYGGVPKSGLCANVG